MTAEDYLSATDAERRDIETRAAALLAELAGEHERIRQASSYALLGGGKRVRGVLCLRAHEAAGGGYRGAAIDAACAIECVHAYSLVHDDLPCMDNDDWRRGKPSCHVEFGEATAVLVGDELLTLAFHILSTIPARQAVPGADAVLAAVQVLAHAAGTGGLVAGQALDLAGGGANADLAAVERIHANKTARLIAAAVEVGAVLADANKADRDALRTAGMAAGGAFQIVDDILDIEGDKETLGKTPGKDVQTEKLTYPGVAGLEEARREAQRRVGAAKKLLPDTEAGERLAAVFDFITQRGF